MFIFVIQTIPKKWNEIYMEPLANGKRVGNNSFLRILKFKMQEENGEPGRRGFVPYKGCIHTSLSRQTQLEFISEPQILDDLRTGALRKSTRSKPMLIL